jgi:hypothetical protein
MRTRYFRFRLNGQLYGLVRRRDNVRGIPTSLSSVEDGEWVDDADLYGYWINPGTDELIEVDAAEARRVAAEMGVEVAAKATRVAPIEDDVPVTTWDALPTVVRRSFDEYLRRFTAANPAAALRRVADPVRVDGAAAWSVSFEDSATDANYVTLVGDDGSVAKAVEVA